MKILLIAYCCVVSGLLYGQSIEPQVVATTGSFGTASTGTTLSWTVGEVITTTESSSTATLTQGFQQPIMVNIVAVNELIPEKLHLQVYPNPTTEQVTIKKEHTAPLQATLIDVLGRVLEQRVLEDNQTVLNVDHLPASSYFLRVTDLNGQDIQTFKIQKIR
ncbi:MAG: T9SS type A sorting domain-containing protein [Aureispira sp.]|nr:T9SS type A sorting domain-containing protein [Aureispira sp.]